MLLKEGMHWRISRSDMDVFEVRMKWNRFVVCLDDRTCTCVQWQHNCFPCSHALQVLHHDNHDVFEYVEDYWKADRETYQFVMNPVSNLDKPNVNNFTNGVSLLLLRFRLEGQRRLGLNLLVKLVRQRRL